MSFTEAEPSFNGIKNSFANKCFCDILASLVIDLSMLHSHDIPVTEFQYFSRKIPTEHCTQNKKDKSLTVACRVTNKQYIFLVLI